ncbi:MAG TPA: outer membrane beta-barrel protein [Candidatus Saccharimonadales bacterium]|nr:outer membrane beta-barrel protein [Candidatus Saccharimonadales bacterium]
MLALAGNVAMAQTSDEKFPVNQLSLDVFGTYHQAFETFGSQFDKSWTHGRWGGGLGLNYFFNRYIGVGVDSYSENHGPFFNNVAGSVFLRMPIGDTGLAPYIFGGVGDDFNPQEITEHAGIGLEYRFNSHWGIFADTRYTYADKTENTSLTRAGLRYGF